MQTGIKFFDDREFKPGDVVVLGGFAASGKSLVSTAIAVGLARNTDADVLHVNLESPREVWARRVQALAPDVDLANLRYRGIFDGAFSPSELGKAAIVLDHIGLAASKDHLHEFARVAKLYAVRQRTVVVLVTQLSREIGVQISVEGWVAPTKLPEWVLEFGDQIYLLRNGHGGGPPSCAVICVKGECLYSSPDLYASLDLSDGRARVR